VLDAARDLFEEIGYEAATIRAIALRAEVSVGSVFTTFSSKAHILGQVMQDRLGDLYDEMDRVLPHLRGSGADRCRSLFAAHYAFELRRSRLFLAFIAAAYDWSSDPVAPVFGTNQHLRGMVRACLEGGIAHGDVSPQADLDMAIDLLLATYAWNYRLAASQNADAPSLIALMDRQIGMIFLGLAP
jgi:AcrR family transcriptional regulator